MVAGETARLQALEDAIADLAAGISRSIARWLALIAEFDDLGGAKKAGFRSLSSWLAWRCGLSQRAARDHVLVARRLRSLPLTTAAFARGELSYSKVRAIARAQHVEDEAALLEIARCSTAYDLELHLRQLRSAPSADVDVAQAAFDRRGLDWRWDEDGSLLFSGRLPADVGAAFIDAIERGAEALHPVPDEQPYPSVPARRADALGEIMLSGAPPAQIVLHADPESLGEVCALEEGPAVPPETARRLACDGVIVDGHGRTRRLPSAQMRRALQRRDGRCRFPGCVRRHGLVPHHCRHWVHGGATDPDNLVLLCRFHHRAVHEAGFRVDSSDDAFVFRRPDGRVIPDVPPTARAGPPALAVAA